MKTFWWNQIPNAGDLLTPLLLSRYAGIESEWVPIVQAEAIAVGSILEHVASDWTGHIAGAGRIREDSTLHLDSARIHGVRGPLSAKGLRGDFALGDPGLLADELVDVETRDIELGLVPHWSDTDLANRYLFQQYNPVVISAWLPPLEFVAMIGRCKKIVASSLHGVILADAFGIPRRTEMAPRFRDDPREGNFFKFRDYDASVGIPFETGKTQSPARGAVEDRKHEVYDMLMGLGDML